MAGQSVDVLRSHVAEAQARANHIVEEFESMLMVTGGHSIKEVLHLQSQAGLASNSPPAVQNRKPVSCHDHCSFALACFVARKRIPQLCSGQSAVERQGVLCVYLPHHELGCI